MTTRHSRPQPAKAVPTKVPAVPVTSTPIDGVHFDESPEYAAALVRVADPAWLRGAVTQPAISASSVPQELPAPKLLHTVEEVARALRVCTKTVRRRIAAGVIRRADLGGRVVRIPDAELRRLLGSARDGDR